MSTLQRISFQISMAAMMLSMGVSRALAQFGPVPDIGGPDPGSGPEGVREVVIRVLVLVLNFLALLAIIFIVIAGIRLIVSQGEEGEKDKAKKTILYVVIGLIVVLLARVIVGFFADNPFD